MEPTTSKTLVTIATCEAPHYLAHAVESYERFDPGADHELLIVDNGSQNPEQKKLLEKYSKKYRVDIRENAGRAQGAYDYAWRNNKDFKYYFFLHDDIGFLRNNWLGRTINRMNDRSYEKVYVNAMPGAADEPTLQVGKVGHQGYEYQNRTNYLRTGYRALMYYSEELAEVLGIELPKYWQHINDDKILYRAEVLEANDGVWNLESAKRLKEEDPDKWQRIYDFFAQRNMCNPTPFPNNNYPVEFHPFEIVIELLSDLAPFRCGYRSHCLLNDGNCQEELGWNSFWGNEYIAHYGDHVVFKRLSILLRANENEIRKRFKDKTFLTICDNMIRKETNHVER